ncbi:hypothetical protein Tco_0390990 [Tanacetum coccineum]
MVKSGREDIHDLRSVETEFPAIAFNDEVSSEKPLSYEPTVSSLNDEIDFRISFDDSDDEDYTNYYRMLFYLIMNLYVPFGIPFDPKRYYKDEFYKEVAEANGDYTLALFKLGKLVSKNGYGVLVLENMDAYRDEGMGDVIFGEPFLREVRIKTRRFEWMITIYNGDDEVNEEDKMNGISHPFQKLKGFYKGVLNLGPDYIRDAKMEEWLTRGHISMHEME